MGDKNKCTLIGKLSGEPPWGFDYYRTRAQITPKMLTFNYRVKDANDKPTGREIAPFKGIVNFEVKDEGDFESIVMTERGFLHTTNEGLAEELAVLEMLNQLQNHCGIAKVSRETAAEAQKEGYLLLDSFRDFKRED